MRECVYEPYEYMYVFGVGVIAWRLDALLDKE